MESSALCLDGRRPKFLSKRKQNNESITGITKLRLDWCGCYSCDRFFLTKLYGPRELMARYSTATLFAITITGITAGCSGSGPPVPPPISVTISPSAQKIIDQGQTVAVSANVANDPSGEGVSWILAGPGSLSNSTAMSVTYNSPATTIASAQQATVTATSITDKSKSTSVQITVNPPLQIPFQTLANGSVGVPYSQTIGVTGGTPPFQWSVFDGPILTGAAVGGSVPDGLTLNATTGAITGTPVGGGTWFFEASVTDAAGGNAVNGFISIRINPRAASANPVPFLNQTLVPAAVSPGSAGIVLGVTGTGFVSGATVDFNSAPLVTTFVDSKHLTAAVPATDTVTSGTASVTVMNPAPGGGRSNVAFFQIGTPETTVNFANAPNSPLQIPIPTGLAVGDFNEDGKPDLAIAGNVRTYVLLGEGNGTFTMAAGSPISVLSPPYDDFPTPDTGPIATGDFNHSGHLGLAVALLQSQAATILLGNGDGTFVFSSAAFANALGNPTVAVEAADFNADGNLDLAFANELSGQEPVVLGYGRGAFSAAGDLFIRGFPTGLAVGDFNADGKLDAIVVGARSMAFPFSGVAVSLGNGDGTFTQASGSPISLGTSLSAIVAADFNGDGKLDVAVTDSGTNAVHILTGNGDGTFLESATISVGNQPGAIVAGDFNNDGKLDLAVANSGDGTVTLLLGNGDGTFTPASGSPYAVGQGPTAIVAADFNGDGKLDLAVANTGGGTVSILLQH